MKKSMKRTILILAVATLIGVVGSSANAATAKRRFREGVPTVFCEPVRHDKTIISATGCAGVIPYGVNKSGTAFSDGKFGNTKYAVTTRSGWKLVFWTMPVMGPCITFVKEAAWSGSNVGAVTVLCAGQQMVCWVGLEDCYPDSVGERINAAPEVATITTEAVQSKGLCSNMERPVPPVGVHMERVQVSTGKSPVFGAVQWPSTCRSDAPYRLIGWRYVQCSKAGDSIELPMAPYETCNQFGWPNEKLLQRPWDDA